LEACTEKAQHTLVVAGNHEYYQGNRFSIGQTKTKILSICDFINRENKKKNFRKTKEIVDCFTINNEPIIEKCMDKISTINSYNINNMKGDIHFLDNTTYTYNIPFSQQSIKFIGSTLWSYISPEYEKEIYNNINDYNYIMDFTPKLSRNMYIRACDFINTELTKTQPTPSAQNFDDETNITNIIVTHYPPTTLGVSNPKFDGSNLQSAFSSDFVYQSNVVKPDAWIFGHTHYNVNRLDNTLGTLLLSNQIGYPGEDCGSSLEN
jgi:hypothetical protein